MNQSRGRIASTKTGVILVTGLSGFCGRSNKKAQNLQAMQAIEGSRAADLRQPRA
jgi:hypothetical protein